MELALLWKHEGETDDASGGWTMTAYGSNEIFRCILLYTPKILSGILKPAHQSARPSLAVVPNFYFHSQKRFVQHKYYSQFKWFHLVLLAVFSVFSGGAIEAQSSLRHHHGCQRRERFVCVVGGGACRCRHYWTQSREQRKREENSVTLNEKEQHQESQTSQTKLLFCFDC